MIHGRVGFLEAIRVDRIANAGTAGTGTTTSSAVTMGRYEGVLFIASIGAIVATGTVYMKIQGSNDNSTYVDVYNDRGEQLKTASFDDTGDNGLLMIDIGRAKTYKYYKALVVAATANVTVEGIYAFKSGGNDLPVDQATTNKVKTGVNPQAA